MSALRRFIMVMGLLLYVASALPAQAQEKGRENEWSRILAEAKNEGKVVVATPPDAEVRKQLGAAFKAKFGIPIEFIMGRSSEIAARTRIERRAGITTIDVFMSGIGTLSKTLYAEKMLDPLKPLLTRPDVVDPSKWKKGELWFMDPEKQHVLRLFNYLDLLISINTRHVQHEDLSSIKNFLKPKWKGKISGRDPTIPGGGSNTAAQLYVQFGEGFVKRLYVDQKMAFSRNRRQLGDWLARGIHHVSIGGVGGDGALELQAEGFPVRPVYSLPGWPGIVGAGNGLLAVVNRRPHPNAARIFVNWIASKEGLEILARTRNVATTRKDVDESFLPPELIPRPEVNYFDSYGWEFTINEREKVRLLMKKLLGK